VYRCDHASYPRRDRITAPGDVVHRPRETIKPSIKVGCTARLTVKKLCETEELHIVIDLVHTNHEPGSLADMRASRLTPQVEQWLQNQVDMGHGWPAIERYLELPEEVLDEVCIVSDDVRIKLTVMLLQAKCKLYIYLLKNRHFNDCLDAKDVVELKLKEGKRDTFLG
jgi:hypothetical protein